MAEGIQERHTQACQSRRGARCNCRRTYRASVYDPRTKTKAVSPRTPDKAAAAKWRTQALREIEAETSAGVLAPSATRTLADAWSDWIAKAEAGAISNRTGQRYKASTLASYAGAWEKLKDEFGARRVGSITRFDLQRWASEQASNGMPRSTLNNAIDPLRVLYRRAVKNGEVATNPTTDLDLPAKAEEPIRIVTPAEAAALVKALPETEQALWATAFYTGLRRSELRALRAADIDFKAHVVIVTRAWTQAEGSRKTQAGVRRVPLPALLADMLKAHLKREGRSGSDLVFGRTATEPFVASTIRTRALKAWKAAEPELEPIGLHSCRHTCASFLIESGANAKALSVVMGHASIEITFNLYGHLMPGAEQEVGKMLDGYLRGNGVVTADT